MFSFIIIFILVDKQLPDLHGLEFELVAKFMFWSLKNVFLNGWYDSITSNFLCWNLVYLICFNKQIEIYRESIDEISCGKKWKNGASVKDQSIGFLLKHVHCI